jgi:transposase
MTLAEAIAISPKPARKVLEAAAQERDLLLAERARLERELQLQREKMRLLLLAKFGRKSDALDSTQLELLEGEPAVEAAEVEGEAALPESEKKVPRRVRPHPGRQELPAHLPRVEEIVRVEGEERLCPCCGKERCVIGHETKEELDVRPPEYWVRVIKREKLACREHPEGGVGVAPVAGSKIVPKGKLSDAVLIDVTLKKFCDHLPLYRQEARLLQDHGLEIARQTLSDGVMAVGGLLQAVVGAMRQDLLGGGYIQADETPVGVQSERTRGRNHSGFQWQYSRPGGPVVFDFQMSRAREGPRRWLEGYAGILQTDGYAGYDRTGGAGLIRAGCWAHARRKFVDVLKLDATNAHAREVVDLIGQLYATEARAREAKLLAAQRLELRREQSAPVVEALRTKIAAIRAGILPGGKLAQACNYSLGQWGRLTRFLEHGELEIDNNVAENSMRPLALGRKNWLHIGDEKAGPKIAAILSIIETCRRSNIPVREYLLDVLPRLGEWPSNRAAELAPSAWAARRAT